MQMQGEEDQRREDNITEVSNNLCNGHHISASVAQMSSPGASTSDVIINVEQE